MSDTEAKENSQESQAVKEINITYETLFELLRREKNREEIQKLNEGFLNDVANYLKEKIELGLKQRGKNDLFAAEETRKVELQITNIKKILREFYERREKKILNMAIDASRSSTSLVDASNLLKEEKRIFEEFVENLNKYRKGILYHLLEGMEPNIKKEMPESKEPEVKPEPKEEIKEEVRDEEKPKTEETAEIKQEQKTIKMIRFVNPVPKFVGKDLEIYGPFEENDMANLPAEIADVLIAKGRAEKMDN